MAEESENGINMKATNTTRNIEIADKLAIADSMFSRMKGLLGKDSLQKGEALLIKPCMGIHTFGMRFPIDVIFLDKQNKVVALKKNVPPNRMSAIHFSAASVMELSAGVLDDCDITTGDQINIGSD